MSLIRDDKRELLFVSVVESTIPVPDSFSAGAESTTEFPASVRVFINVLMFISAQPSSLDKTTLTPFTIRGKRPASRVVQCILCPILGYEDLEKHRNILERAKG